MSGEANRLQAPNTDCQLHDALISWANWNPTRELKLLAAECKLKKCAASKIGAKESEYEMIELSDYELRIKV